MQATSCVDSVLGIEKSLSETYPEDQRYVFEDRVAEPPCAPTVAITPRPTRMP